jgi:hypothetical protein
VPPDADSTAAEAGAEPAAERPAASDPEPASERTPAASPAPVSAPSASDLEVGVRADAGAGCDLRGQWLITQHTIASGLGVKQRAAWWFYYEIEQAGSDLTVTRGLVCGSQVFPVDPLSASVEFDASFPAMIANNSHAGRRGTATASGDGCSVSFERAIIVVGATTPFYASETNPLPTLDQPASDTSPGWEDWDEDGNPAVTLHVSGLVEGERYTALRAFVEWSGTIPAGVATFRLPVSDWGQEESVLGVTAELLKETGVPDADRSGHFTQFARLQPDQVQGDASAICAAVRQLAPTLTPDANR